MGSNFLATKHIGHVNFPWQVFIEITPICVYAACKSRENIPITQCMFLSCFDVFQRNTFVKQKRIKRACATFFGALLVNWCWFRFACHINLDILRLTKRYITFFCRNYLMFIGCFCFRFFDEFECRFVSITSHAFTIPFMLK